jgi:hypothetical protein
MKPEIALTWGSTERERQLRYPCDRYLPDNDEAYFRAIDVNAPTPTLFRWLCQLKVASYSYDWIDNLERLFFEGKERIPLPDSPQELTPGAEILAPEQRFMGVFKLVEFEPNRHLTMVMDAPLAVEVFGEVAASYVIFPKTPHSCRLVLKGLLRYPRNSVWSGMRWVLPWGDLWMMQQQFRTLKRLAETQAVR